MILSQRVVRAASAIATTLDGSTDAIHFDPTTQIPPLRDLMHFTIYEAEDSENAAKRRIDLEISQLRDGCG